MSDFEGQDQSPQDFIQKLKAARASRRGQGERRIVTILFCDVVGSTHMAEQLDPEEWAGIMDDAFDFLIAPIYRYEGTVGRLMGDAILAFFGAPVAHEDDPQRAILAGLELVSSMQPFRQHIFQEYGLDFNVRVGINTGSVVVGEIGSDLAGEYTAMGDAVNLAARMEQTAQSGTVQVAEDTYRLVEPLFDFEALGGIEVKGKDAFVQAYRVLGKKERPGRVRGIRGLMSPLVGREAELHALMKTLEDLKRGRGGVVTLIGEAGLGKTRLMDDLHAQWLLEAEDCLWFESRGVSYETNRPYHLFVQHLRQVCDVKESDPPEVVRQKLVDSMDDLAAQGSGTLIQSVDLLLTAENQGGEHSLEGEAFKHQLFEAILNLWRQMADRAPVVLAFDDLQWADRASVELLVYIFRLAEEVPILLLCAFRPHRSSPAWRLKQVAETDYPHRYVEMFLDPLPEASGDELISNLLVNSDMPADLRQMILQKAEGNPFFLEEVVRALIENGVIAQDETTGRWQVQKEIDQLSIPDSLQAVLLARMDRLESDVRQTLQVASVIGRTFTRSILEEISGRNGNLDGHLNTLQRVELIRETARLPEPEYTFLHELTREAAYHSILRRNRREYHRRVGETLEKLFPDKRDQEAHNLARHFEEARDYDKALHYYTLAGDTAARLYANSEAVTQYSRALEIAQHKPASIDQLSTIYLRRGRAYEMSGQYDQALANYETLQSLAEERDNPAAVLDALIAQTTIYSIPSDMHNPEKGRALSQRALEMARQLGDHRAEAKALWNLMLVTNFIQKDFQEAVRYGEQGLDIARRHDLREEVAYILNDISRVYLEVGRQEEARDALEEVHGLWRELDNLPMLADSLATMAQGLHILGEYDLAMEKAQEALQTSRSIGNHWVQAYSLSILGPVHFERGHVSQGLQCLDEAYPLAIEANFGGAQLFVPALKVWIYGYLGDFESGLRYFSTLSSDVQDQIKGFEFYYHFFRAQAFLMAGQADQAAKALDEIEADLVVQEIDVYFGPLIQTMIAEIAMANRDYQRAMGLVGDTLKGMAKVKARLFLPDLLHLKGRLQVQLGEPEEGYNTVLEAYREAKAQVSRRSIWPVLVDLMRMDMQRGESMHAERWRVEARSVIETIAGHIDDTGLKESFLNLPRVREVVQGSI
jgi:class 3 adenylate cyclase/tetratricopeptide (TPR) repeat protein